MSYTIRRPITDAERIRLGEMSGTLAHLLFHRGITDNESARSFIEPDYATGTHDPFLLKDGQKAAERIIQAIKDHQRIAIYSDYDADGIPGAAIFDDFFKKIKYANYSVYIPHRHDEGFGLNSEAVEQLAGQGVNLIITIDCGITDTIPVDRVNELGLEIIITDHHEPPEKLPAAYAIVDHKQKDCLYPDKNLCGSGVAYKLIQTILKIESFGLKEGMEKWMLDLVGIATMSDMVPLTGENRIFAHYGLSVLRKSPRKGIVQLLRKLKIEQKSLSEDDISFMVTPRINAASRMGLPMDAFRLLSASTDDEAHIYAEKLEEVNNERKGAVAALVKEVKKTLTLRYGKEIPLVIVLGNPLWRPSLLGLVANTCAEEYDRPVFLWGRDGENIIKGSCRSEGSTNIVELMRATAPESFLQFGGHHHSGGFSVSNGDIHFLEKRLNDAAQEIASRMEDSSDANESADEENAGSAVPTIDLEITLDEADSSLQADLNRLAPFGISNPKPVFLFRKVIPAVVRIFGKSNDHVEIVFNKADGQKISAISFFGAGSDWAKKIQANKPIDLVASLEKSYYRGRAELRLRVIDVVGI